MLAMQLLVFLFEHSEAYSESLNKFCSLHRVHDQVLSLFVLSKAPLAHPDEEVVVSWESTRSCRIVHKCSDDVIQRNII